MLLLTFSYHPNNGAGAELLRGMALFIGFAVCGFAVLQFCSRSQGLGANLRIPSWEGRGVGFYI